MLTKLTVAAMCLAASAELVLAPPAAAQDPPDCPVACECNPPSGCHCFTPPQGGGTARDCIGGGLFDCQLIICEKPEGEEELAFSPDGSVMRLRDLLGSGLQEGDEGDPGSQPRRWSTVKEGLAIARDCAGLIVARYYTDHAAAAAREQSRRLAV